MAQISRSTKVNGTTSLAASTRARAQDVETDAATIFAAWNAHDAGTSAWQVVKATNATSVPLVANNSAGTQNIFEAQDNGTACFTVADGGTATFTGTAVIPTATITTLGHTLAGYRRPVLKWVSITSVDVENNTGTANQTTIVFPDGSVRSVTEDTSSTHKYRRFIITDTAQFTTGTEDSGMRSGESEAVSTWYGMYAVKSAVDATKFVLVGSVTIPTQGNFATLNTNLGGANNWVYLGMIRNGDNSGTTGDILKFVQNGNTTYFQNTCVMSGTSTAYGTRLAQGTGDLTWTYASGTGAAQVPSHILVGQITITDVEVGSSGNHTVTLGASAGRSVGTGFQVSLGEVVMTVWMPLSENVRIASTADDNNSIALSGYMDGALNGTTSIL